MSTKKPAAKKPAATKKAKPVITTEQIQAPYTFNSEEVLKMGVEMRGHMTAADELRDQLKNSTADFKLRIGNHESSVKQLRIKLDSGQETRPVEAVVQFHTPKKNEKTFLHPESKEVIRTEQMTPADFQLPMFKPDPKTGGEAVAPKGAADIPAKAPATPPKKGKAKEPSDNQGKTPIAAALNEAAGKTKPPQIDLEFSAIDDESKLVGGFKKAAKAAGWSNAQISTINDALKACEGVGAMKDVLKPHIVDNPSEQPE